ncbi:hypothetical protein J4447_02205 [Candidatus Pacearchaeota archaeon]|nr:hypothetical protein [Candidatus Pacearchaeota archaeon]
MKLCIYCKGGRNLCKLGYCPLIARKKEIKIGEDFFGKSPSVFVGRFGYPDVFAGPTGMTEGGSDNPAAWFGSNYSDIIESRSALLRTKKKQNIFSKERFALQLQEIALAAKPADTEMHFSKKPRIAMTFSDVMQPFGPTASIEKLRIAENVKIERSVEKIASDDLKASQAGNMLYEDGQDVYKITTILSSGALGMKKKLVPTRWSITATDDMIFKSLIKRVKEYKIINGYLVFSSQYLDNHFEILLMPGSWQYEGFEAWSPGSYWTKGLKEIEIVEEYEPYEGRKAYAEKQAGGYYAARIGVAEGLCALRKQASAIIFREIYEGYTIPLGVWVVRETVRNAFKQKPLKFDSLEDALAHIGKKLRVPIGEYRKRSSILRQSRLDSFKNFANNS